jgi:site-specific DNA recombinase
VALHPAVLTRYEQGLEELERCLASGLSAGDQDGARALHDLIEIVTVRRGDDGPGSVRIEITGRLNALLGEEAYPNRVWGGMVPQEGIEPPTYALRSN